MSGILKIDKLTFGYEEKQVLKEISFTLNANEIACIKGSNGAGKTTLFKVLCGILKPEKLQGKFYNREFSYEEIKKEIMFVPSAPYLYGALTGKENLELIRNLWSIDKEKYYEKIDYYSKRYSMKKYLDEFVENYSLGMKYKLFFIAALAVEKNVMLMDEPLNAMDKESQDLAIDDLKKYVLNNDKAILFSSHISSLISELATKEYILQDGKLEE